MASLVAQLVKNLPAMQETWVGKIPWRRERLPTPVFWPGEFHGLYSLWGLKESDVTEGFSLSLYIHIYIYIYIKSAYVTFCLLDLLLCCHYFQKSNSECPFIL